MPNYEQSALIMLENHLNELRKTGFDTSNPKKAQYNYWAEVSGKDGTIKLLVYFGKKGNKILLQGNKDIEVYRKTYNLIFGETFFSKNSSELIEPEIYIGTDESGKGDYFGPLVVAAVLTNPSVSKSLITIGVKDSKELTDDTISVIASKIKKIEDCIFSTIIISPDKYNLLYNKIGNLNRLLGWAHAKAIENVLDVKSASVAISDKFGNEKYILNSLQKKGRELKLHQVTKAERYTAVAAASILARDSFNKWFFGIKKKMNLMLPKGASKKVEEKAKFIKNEYGSEVLSKLVKLHFKTTTRI